MESKEILHADYLDLIYDRRNKQYGGYELRKHYNRRAAKALGITSLLLLLGVAGPVILGKLENKAMAAGPEYEEKAVIMDHIHMTPPKPERPPEAPKPPKAKTAAPPPVARTEVFVEPKVVENDKAKIKPPEIKDMEDAVAGPVKHEGEGGSEAATSKEPRKGPFGDGGDPEGKPTGGYKPADTPVRTPDEMPEYPGGMAALASYLKSNLRYPAAAAEDGIEGRVIISFVVGTDGSILDAKVARGIGGGCDKEALRVVNAMKKWKPGKQGGHLVKVYYTLPISFALHR